MMDPDALGRLTGLAHESLNELAGEVCKQRGSIPPTCLRWAMAGNATMTHLALGIDPEPLGVAPFSHVHPASWPEVLAADIGVGVHPRARAVGVPSFGAYVGGDIYWPGCWHPGWTGTARTRLFVDIGTNCEIVLGNRDWLLGTAAPAGPAFEGAAIRCGMRARRRGDRGRVDDPGRPGASRSSGMRRRPGCADPGWWTRSPSWCGSGCWTPPGG